MNLLSVIFIEFFKIGLFAIGGGMATLPFLYHLSIVYKWFSPENLAQMLAIANIVPGPVGINLATQVGYKANGFLGALAAALGIIVPSLIFVFIVAKLLKEFEGNRFVKSIFYMLKPASCAMIAAIGIKLIKSTLIIIPQLPASDNLNWDALILLIFLITLNRKNPLSPLLNLTLSAFAGILNHIVRLLFIG